MRIVFNSTRFYYLTTKENKKRKDHIVKEFKEFNLTEVNPIPNTAFNHKNPNIRKKKSGVSGFSRILDLACKNQIRNKPFQPFVILEDDVKKYRAFPSNIVVPDNSDIFYIGLSCVGKTDQDIGVTPAVCYSNVNKDIIRIYNMLSTHGMIICSARGLLSLQKCLMDDFHKNRGWDISIAEMQPYINVYAFKIPLVYQSSELGGHEKCTKIDYKKLNNKIIPDKWINKTNLSICTLSLS